jgi:hypothetical protein
MYFKDTLCIITVSNTVYFQDKLRIITVSNTVYVLQRYNYCVQHFVLQRYVVYNYCVQHCICTSKIWCVYLSTIIFFCLLQIFMKEKLIIIIWLCNFKCFMVLLNILCTIVPLLIRFLPPNAIPLIGPDFRYTWDNKMLVNWAPQEWPPLL